MYTMEYYSTLKKNEIMKFEGKMMEWSNPDPKGQILQVFSIDVSFQYLYYNPKNQRG